MPSMMTRGNREKSRGRLRSVFDGRLRSSSRGGSTLTLNTIATPLSAATAGGTTGGTRSGGCTAGRGRSTAALSRRVAATGLSWLTASLPTTTVAGFCRVGAHRECNTKRQRQTKQTIHPDLLQSRDISNTGRRPSADQPPAAVLSLDCSTRGILLGRLGELLQVSHRLGCRISA